MMFALLSLGRIQSEGYGRFVEAETCLTHSLRIARELCDDYTGASILASLGDNARSRGEFGRARAALEEARVIFEEFGDRAYGGAAIQAIGQIAYVSGDYPLACALAQEAVTAVRNTGHFRTRRLALRLLGHALFAMGNYTDAAVAYWEARDLEQRIQNSSLEIDTLTGLVRVALAQGKMDWAASQVAVILGTLAKHGVGGIEEPVRVYLTCHAVFRARHDPRADAVLAAGHTLLMGRAAQFADEHEREVFVGNILAHRELQHEWCQLTLRATNDQSQMLQRVG